MSIPEYAFELHPMKAVAIGCRDAARQKGIPIRNELKTLILETGIGLAALHLRGNEKASLRSIKRALKTKRASLASSEVLGSIGLKPGCVCPFVREVWQLRSLVSVNVLDLEYVSTNNGTTDFCIFFNPKLLLLSNNVVTGVYADS
jgi:prolyl-tRNA editing enzyme YbaK/EbsC (Cys-tRNA(Pro) deacylase)